MVPLSLEGGAQGSGRVLGADPHFSQHVRRRLARLDSIEMKGHREPGIPAEAEQSRGDALVAAAVALADALGESGREPLRQLRRLVRVCGVDLPERLLQQALAVESGGGLSTKDGGRRRTLGGVFFRLARDHFHASDRAVFYRVFQQPRSRRTARVPWTDRPRGLAPSTAGKGEVKNVKITITGRPEQIARGRGFVVLTMVSRKPPSLPRGLPTPGPVSTSYALYVADKQWRRVEPFLADPNDFLIVEGYPHLDAEERTIAVFVHKATTRRLEGTAPG